MTTPADYPDARPPGAGRIDPGELDAGITDAGRIEPDRIGAGVEPNQPSGTGMDEPPYLVNGAAELTSRWQQALQRYRTFFDRLLAV